MHTRSRAGTSRSTARRRPGSAGRSPPTTEIGFGITLEADVDPGIVELQAEQRYPDGSQVSWPVALTITPEDESPSQNLALAGVIGLIGVLLVVAVAMLAWRRRGRTLQER